MATLNITTSDAGFLNSGDMRLILKGYAPTIVVGQPSGIAQPDSGALTLTGKKPATANTTISPATGSLNFVGHSEIWGVGLVLRGYAPTVIGGGHFRSPSTATASLTTYAPYRPIGLLFYSDAPTATVSKSLIHDPDNLVLSGKVPQVTIQTSTNTVRAPETYSVSLSGKTPGKSVSNGLQAGNPDALAFGSSAPSVLIDAPLSPGVDALVLTGRAPKANVEGELTVIISAAANPGTPITNSNAGPVESNYQICDRTGFKIKIKHGIYEEWNGSMVRGDSFENRNMQDFVRSKTDRQEGPMRPESERFIEDEYPDGVDTDDL